MQTLYRCTDKYKKPVHDARTAEATQHIQSSCFFTFLLVWICTIKVQVTPSNCKLTSTMSLFNKNILNNEMIQDVKEAVSAKRNELIMQDQRFSIQLSSV